MGLTFPLWRFSCGRLWDVQAQKLREPVVSVSAAPRIHLHQLPKCRWQLDGLSVAPGLMTAQQQVESKTAMAECGQSLPGQQRFVEKTSIREIIRRKFLMTRRLVQALFPIILGAVSMFCSICQKEASPLSLQFSSVQSLSRVQLFATPWTEARQASLSITNSQSSLKLTSIELVMPSSYLILCHPLLLLPSIFPSIRVFSNESALHIRRPKYWSFSFTTSLSNEHSGLISFSMGWLDLPAVQGTLKSLLQHHSSKASILRYSAFFIVHLSHPYMTTGKTIALTRWTFAEKVMSLLFSPMWSSKWAQ